MPFVIAVTGGSGSGKSFLAKAISYNLNIPVSIYSYDCYYRGHPELPLSERAKINYDSPAELDEELYLTHLEAIKRGEKVQLPQYDFANHLRKKMARAFTPKEIVIVEGILTMSVPGAKYDFTIFVDADPDVRLSRRIMRDTAERGRSVQSVINQYLSSVKPMHEKYIEPHKKEADLVFLNNGGNGIEPEKMAELIAKIKEAYDSKR
ncbi:MAG: uridine kinase [Bacillota bacterium]|nr:uridine kinase [Bacillota bacterium]